MEQKVYQLVLSNAQIIIKLKTACLHSSLSTHYSIHSGADWDRRKASSLGNCLLNKQRFKIQWISSTSDQHLLSLLQSYVIQNEL